jgi:ATP-dependent DNA helicase RecG
MAIEHAERFGLSQLHQLRGRVGRGVHQSYCVLLYKGRLSELAYARLSAVEQSTDGFEIAERDLELRGPGDFFGTRQSGIPVLRVGDLFRDYRIMEEARSAASSCLKNSVTSDNEIKEVLFGWSERFGLVGVG